MLGVVLVWTVALLTRPALVSCGTLTTSVEKRVCVYSLLWDVKLLRLLQITD